MCRSPTSKARLAIFVLGAILVGAALGQEGDPKDDDTAADASAAAALANTRVLSVEGRSLNVTSRILDVKGLEAGVGKSSKDVTANVEDLQAAMHDLGAKETELEVRIDLSADVLFDFDKADIRADAAEELAKAATIIKGYPGATVRVIGHTDSKGKDAYNQELSERRARSVVAWFTEREGLTGSAFAVSGKGESEPVAPNEKADGSDDSEGRQKNRRVEIIVRKAG